jgi:signal transduction histidine kinase
LLLMTLLCAILALLQYGWTGELSRAEQARLSASLSDQLGRMSRALQREVREPMELLLPDEREIANSGIEQARRTAFERWKAEETRPGIFSRIAIAFPTADDVTLQALDQRTGVLTPIDWPPEWGHVRDGFRTRIRDGGRPPRLDPASLLAEFPVFGPGGERKEIEWLLLEIDGEYLRGTLLPELIRTYLNSGEAPDYEVMITAGRERTIVYSTLANGGRLSAPDAVSAPAPRGRRMEEKKKRGGDNGGWTIAAQHRQGSLDAAVRLSRWRNLAVVGILLLLIAGAGWALVRSSAEAKRLAQMEFEFVAGVTHEFRTPLTVIRGAAHNLLSGVVTEPQQKERYARLIVQHAENLTELVEQVLGFAGARGGKAKITEQAVWVLDALNEGLEAAASEIEAARCEVDIQVPPEVPPVWGDPVALRRAFQNLIGNAAKHGGEGGWIGIVAEGSEQDGRLEVVIRVRDRGPGISPQDQEHLFDPFFRGERARMDHVRGTGLGLSLVAEIAKAHGGSVTAENVPEGGAEFTLRLPAASQEQYDEFANSAG